MFALDATTLPVPPVTALSIITGVMPIHHRNRPSDDPWAAYIATNPGPDKAPFGDEADDEFEADGFIPRNATPPF